MQPPVICALDNSNLAHCVELVKRVSPWISKYKVGHALTLQHGLSAIDALRAAGAERIFLDLKFHDIPNSVALAVREAAQRDVWMTTVHTTGGSDMMRAAVDAAEGRTHVVGVSVLTSMDPEMLATELGVARSIEDHMLRLSEQAIAAGLSGVVCSPREVKLLRQALGPEAWLVVPGIRAPGGPTHDQVRVGSASESLSDGATYLVMGRALLEAQSPEKALAEFGLLGTV